MLLAAPDKSHVAFHRQENNYPTLYTTGTKAIVYTTLGKNAWHLFHTTVTAAWYGSLPNYHIVYTYQCWNCCLQLIQICIRKWWTWDKETAGSFGIKLLLIVYTTDFLAIFFY